MDCSWTYLGLRQAHQRCQDYLSQFRRVLAFGQHPINIIRVLDLPSQFQRPLQVPIMIGYTIPSASHVESMLWIMKIRMNTILTQKCHQSEESKPCEMPTELLKSSFYLAFSAQLLEIKPCWIQVKKSESTFARVRMELQKNYWYIIAYKAGMRLDLNTDLSSKLLLTTVDQSAVTATWQPDQRYHDPTSLLILTRTSVLR